MGDNYLSKIKEDYRMLYIEQWKRAIVDGQELVFEVSNLGRVRNFFTKKIIKGWDRKGYLRVKDTKLNKMFAKHRLVALMFLPYENPYDDVHHLDGNKRNNSWRNLQWLDHSTHSKIGTDYRLEAIRISVQRRRAKNFKYPEEQIRLVCKMLEENQLTCAQISKITHVSVGLIYQILYGKSWVDVSKEYDFSKHRHTIKQTQETIKWIEECINRGEQIKDVALKLMEIESLSYKKAYHVVQNVKSRLNREAGIHSRDYIKYTDNDIRKACRLLAKGNSVPDVARTIGLEYAYVHSLFKGKIRKDITKNYDFSKVPNKNFNPYRPDTQKMIIKGFTRKEVIAFLEEKGLSFIAAKSLYHKIKNELKKSGCIQ